MSDSIFRRSMDRVTSMDPANAASVYASRAVQLVYEPLLEFDYTKRPYILIPGLAEELPEISDNGLVYLIKVRTNAWFTAHPCFGVDAGGMPLKRRVCADDVIYSLKRLADRRVSSPGAWLVEDTIRGMRNFAEQTMRADNVDDAMAVEGLQALDEQRVRIELTKPVQQFVWYLAMTYTAIVPHEAVNYYGKAFATHAVGSGPYTLSKWRRNHRMLFDRNKEWHGWSAGPAALTADASDLPFEQVEYRVVDDVSTQWLCFLSGELEFLGEVSRDNWDAVIDPAGELVGNLQQRGITLHSIPSLEVAYLGINMFDPVLGTNKFLRQALNCAIDHDVWVEFYNQRVLQCDSPVPPGVSGRLESKYVYASNLDKARALMEAAGYKNGIDTATNRRLELTLDLGRTSQDMRESVDLLVAFYERIGVVLKPQYHNWATFLKRVSERQSQLFRIGWIGDYPDAENFLQLFYGRNISPGPNRTNFVNSEFDQLYETACVTQDETRRNQLWQQAQAIVREECPWVFLHFNRSFSLCQNNVKNYVPSDFPHGSEKYLRVKQK